MDEVTKNENKYFVGIKFRGQDKSYYFSTNDASLKINEMVIVDTVAGREVGFVSTEVKELNKYKSSLELKPIIRIANDADRKEVDMAAKIGLTALEITRKEVKNLNLDMNLINAIYALDLSKVTITYTSSEKRVDFRELLTKLAPLLHTRIELHQIASRDKAKLIGGIGTCGLPLCCSTFLNTFDSISINLAKNQMLTINIPKLSGPCGKWLCCLAYEDDLYTEAKKEFPAIGSKVMVEEEPYFVDSFNILSKNVRLANEAKDDFKTFSLDDINLMLKGKYKSNIHVEKLPEEPKEIIEQTNEKPHGHRNNQNRHNHQNRHHREHRFNKNENKND